MTTPYPFQLKGIRLIEYFDGNVLLADDMGLGKTLQALKWCKHHPRKRPILVICPAHLKPTWQNQALEHTGINAVILEGQKPFRYDPLFVPEMVIINYDILQYWMEWLKGLNAPIIIVDECHYIKTPGIIRTRKVRSLVRRTIHKIHLSGTPALSRPDELWTNLNMIRPDLFSSRRMFRDRFCKPEWTPWGWQYKGATNTAQLHRILTKHLMIRRRKKDVLKELPEKTRIIIPIQLSKAQQEIYDEAQNDFLNWLKKADANKALKAAKALELVKIGYLKRLAVQLKMEYVNKWIVDYYETNEEQKLVLFGIHKQFLRGLQNDFADKKPIVLTGDTPKHKKKLAEKLFQQDPKRKLFIGNIQAAGTGLTLTKSKTGGMLELDWNPGAMIQAEDRLHRITQHDPVMIYYFIAKNTIEEPLCKLLHNKQKVLDQILDGQDVPDFNLYTELKNYLKAKAKG